MKMPTCDSCKIRACVLRPEERAEKKLPLNCPMQDGDYMKEIKAAYQEPEVNPFYVATKTGRAYPKPKQSGKNISLLLMPNFSLK